MTITLYQIAPSFYSQIARLALAEKGVPWTERMVNIGPVMENYEPWFMRLHPGGVVPVLDHDGTIVIETLEIARYVDSHFDGHALMPADPEARARMNAWLQRLNAFPVRELSYGLMLARPIGKLAGHSFAMRRKTLKRRMRSTPDLAARYQARLDDIDAWQRTSTDPAEVASLDRQLRAMLHDLDADLAHGEPWLLGQQFTLADIWLAVLLARLKQLWVGSEGRNLDRQLPERVAAYYERLKSRPAFRAADIWEGVRPGFMIRMLAPFLLPRLLAALAAIAGLAYAGWWLFSHI